MNSGRRGFLKALGALVGGLTLQSKVKAAEQAQASQYMRKFRETSLPTPPPTLKSFAGYPCSGYICITGSYTPTSYSGSFAPWPHTFTGSMED